LRPGASITNSLPIVNVWMLRACSSCVSCSIVLTVAGDGSDRWPPPAKIMVLGLFVVCVWPLDVTVIRWPNTKIAWTVSPSILISAMPPRTETEPVGVKKVTSFSLLILPPT
jgi:hypothetical protein